MKLEMEMEVEMGNEKNPSESMKSIGYHPFLKRALHFLHKIPNSIFLGLRIALPDICTTLVHDLILKHTAMELHSRIRQLPIDTNKANWIYALIFMLVKLNLHYILPLHLLVFLTAILSTFLLSEGWSLMKIREIPQRLVTSKRWWKGSLVKLLLLSLISFLSYGVLVVWMFLGLFWNAENMYFTVICVVGFIAVVVKWIEFTTIWDAGIAVLKEKNESEVFSISKCVRRLSWVHGLAIALLYFYACFGITISNHVKWDVEGIVSGGIIVVPIYIGFIWMKMI